MTTATVGQVFRYEDSANPPRVGTVVEVVTDQWGTRYAIRWDGEPTVTTTSDLRQRGWTLVSPTLYYVYDDGTGPVPLEAEITVYTGDAGCYTCELPFPPARPTLVVQGTPVHFECALTNPQVSMVWMTAAEADAMSSSQGHVCTAACVAASQVECGCSSAPSSCEECVAFFTDHPGAL